MLPSVVEYLYDELDGVSDLMSPVQPLLTQAVTDEQIIARGTAAHLKWHQLSDLLRKEAWLSYTIHQRKLRQLLCTGVHSV